MNHSSETKRSSAADTTLRDSHRKAQTQNEMPLVLYREMIDYSEIGLFVLQHFRFRFINQSLQNMLDVQEPEQLIGKTIWEIVHPEDRENLRSRLTRPADDLAYRGELEYRYLRPDQSLMHLKMLVFESSLDDLMLGSMVDMSEHQSTVRRLMESRQRYYDALEEVADGLAELDLAGRMNWCNTAASRIFGYSREELLGMDYRDYMDPDVAQRVYRAYNRVFKTGIPNRAFSYEIIAKDGSRRILENSITLKQSSEGVPTGFRSVVREVTGRIKAEEELARQRSRLSAIFSSVKDAIITVDTEMRIIEANDAAGTICGIAVGQMERPCFLKRASHCSKACQEVLLETVKRRTTVNEYRIECEHHFRDRQEVVLTSTPLLDQYQQNLGAVLLVRDITRLRSLERELKVQQQLHALVGKSQSMQTIYRLLEDLADIDTTVLITGESGTGKGLVAKALHQNGNRAFAPFITVNCSALPESLMESELFGHVKGAFTGAVKDKQGRFQVADGGVILLDEIGEISPMIQLKLLRVLQDKEFERVGDSRPLSVDVRVIACTNANLKEKVARGEFRGDLYYRLKVMEIKMPPLREHLEDIPLLLSHFCQRFNHSLKKEIKGVSDDVLRRFMNYQWPGNVRELEHAIEHGFVLSHDDLIELDHIPLDIRKAARLKKQKFEIAPDVEKTEIQRVLEKTGWNKAKASRILGIDRSTLYRKMKRYEMRLDADEV